MFRTSRNTQEPIVDVDTLGEIEPLISSSKPGRYVIDEFLPSHSLLAILRLDGAWASNGATEKLRLSRIRGRKAAYRPRPANGASPAEVGSGRKRGT
jgi:hypothetical protein